MKASKENDNNDPTTTDKMLDKAADTINWWTRVSRINADDAVSVVLMKVMMRIVGIIFLIIISPFAILGLIIGFLTVF